MIELKNISKTFIGIEKNTILDDINLEIKDGEFVTVIGGNGAGKSTLFNVINGNYPPTTGSIIIDGKDITRKSRHKRASHIACVFQDPNTGVCPDLTVLENLTLAYTRGKWRGLKFAMKKNNARLFKEKLAEFGLGLENMLKKPASLLSGGQRQVITLLMATMQRPKLLLLDEHTSALDPKIAKQVMDVTQKLVTEQKITTVMISHNMADAIKFGDRLIMLKNGKIELDISGDDKQGLTPAELMVKFE